MRESRRWGVLALVAGMLLASPVPSAAYCQDPDRTVAQELAESEAVFIGRVTAARDVAELCPDPGWTYELEVGRVFKGDLGRRTEVVTENNSGRFPLEVGAEYLLFAKTGCRPLMIFGGCGHSAPVADAALTLRKLEAVSEAGSPPLRASPTHPIRIEQRDDAKVRVGESSTTRSPEEQENFDLLTLLIARISTRLEASDYERLTVPEKTLYVVWQLEAEVNNGGFEQYFYNSAGDDARDAPAALDRIGATRTAALTREAIAKFPAPGPSRDRFIRQEQLLTLSSSGDLFNSLDDRFYEYPEALETLLARYARDNAAQLPPPKFTQLGFQIARGARVDSFNRRITVSAHLSLPSSKSQVVLGATVCDASSRQWTCEGRQDLVDDCFVVRGRLKPYEGGPPNVRIWPIGSKRLLGVEQSADEMINVPPDLDQYVRIGTLVFADFTVCPLTKEKRGHMRLVCVESARRIRVERFSAGGDPPEVMNVPDVGIRCNEQVQPRQAPEPSGHRKPAGSGPSD